MKISPRIRDVLACPKTHQPLSDYAPNSAAAEEMVSISRIGFAAPRFERSAQMLRTPDGRYAYPIVQGFPALLWPEVYTRASAPEQVDLNHRNYAEAYAEMEHYNPTSLKRAEHLIRSDAYTKIKAILRDNPPPKDFPSPLHSWLDARHDTGAQGDSYFYLSPLVGKVFVQLGGDGRHAVKSVLAGASEGVLVTPMLGEAVFARRLAEAAGVADKVSCILGVGEQIPLQDNSVDAVYSPGCLHHMALETALPELRRVLVPSGRFCGHEPWRSPLYSVGTRLFGKREHGLFERSKSIFCQPFTPERLQPLAETFPSHVIHNHGPLFRYPMIVLQKFGLGFSLPTMIRIAQMDDWLGQMLGLAPKWGGSVMLGGEKSPRA